MRARVAVPWAALLLIAALLSLRRLFAEPFDELLERSRAAPDNAPGYAGPPTVDCPARDAAVEALERELDTVVQIGAPRTIWQSDGMVGSVRHWLARRTWRRANPSWRYRFLSDADADAWLVKALSPSPSLQARVLGVYRSFPRPVLRVRFAPPMSSAHAQADFLRYLLLFVAGGVWSDADTRPMQAIDVWVDAATAANESISTVLSIERDYPFRIEPDWLRRGWTAPQRGYAFVQCAPRLWRSG